MYVCMYYVCMYVCMYVLGMYVCMYVTNLEYEFYAPHRPVHFLQQRWEWARAN